MIGLGENVIVVTATGLTVSLKVFDRPFAEAVIVTGVFTDTVEEVMVNAAMLDPNGTTRLLTLGFATPGVLLERVTVIGPGAADASSFTVPIVSLDPITGFGVIYKERTLIGRTVRLTETVFPAVAEILAIPVTAVG